MNRAKKSEYVIERLEYTKKFHSIGDLQTELRSFGVATKDIGYIEPGHGAKGRQMWLGRQEDLDEMYKTIDKKVKREILLWCYRKSEDGIDDLPTRARARKRPLSPVNSTTTSAGSKPKRTAASAQKLQEVEKILKELQEKHAANYDVEKLNAWAHLLHIGKHFSYETPPNYPYFGNGKKKKQLSAGLHPREISSSPSKRLGLRGDCIEQLSKWHSLLEKGAISVEQYDELKETIMGDHFKLGPTDKAGSD